MYRIVYKNFLWPILLLIFTIGGSIGIEFATGGMIPPATIPVIFLLAAIPLFLIFTVLLYSKGRIKQYVIIALTMIVSYVLSMAAILGTFIATGKQPLAGMDLSINPVILFLPLVMSIAIAKVWIDLVQEKIEIPEPKPVEKTAEPQVPVQPLIKEQPADFSQPEVTEQVAQPEEKPDDKEPKSLYDYDKDRPKEESQPEVFLEDLVTEQPAAPSAPEPPATPLYDYDKDRPKEESQPEVYLEDLAVEESVAPSALEPPDTPLYDYDKDRPKEESQPEVYLEDLVVEEPVPTSAPEPPATPLYDYDKDRPKEESQPEVYLEDLVVEEPEPPSLSESPKPQPPVEEESVILEESSPGELPVLEPELPDLGQSFAEEPFETVAKDQVLEEASITEEPVEESIAAQSATQKNEPAGKPVIPKLAQTPRAKEVESGGKITSIGKLLVDHRDIENIIETNALMQSVGSDATTTKIISAVAGTKTNEKLAALNEISGIQSSVIVNQAGFIQASTLKDLHKEQVVGAMSSGTFGIVSNSLLKIGFQPAKDLTLESASGSVALNKINDNIITIFVDTEHSLYNLNELNEILVTAAEREYSDLLESITSVNGIIGVVLSNNSGSLLSSKLIDETKSAENIASMLPAFYNNLGVFVKNMAHEAFRKAIISTGNEVLLFTSIGPNILMLYATLNTAMIPSKLRIQYETIINT